MKINRLWNKRTKAIFLFFVDHINTSRGFNHKEIVEEKKKKLVVIIIISILIIDYHYHYDQYESNCKLQI